MNGGVRVSNEQKKYKIDPTVITEIWREREEHTRKFANKHRRE